MSGPHVSLLFSPSMSPKLSKWVQVLRTCDSKKLGFFGDTVQSCVGYFTACLVGTGCPSCCFSDAVCARPHSLHTLMSTTKGVYSRCRCCAIASHYVLSRLLFRSSVALHMLVLSCVGIKFSYSMPAMGFYVILPNTEYSVTLFHLNHVAICNKCFHLTLFSQ